MSVQTLGSLDSHSLFFLVVLLSRIDATLTAFDVATAHCYLFYLSWPETCRIAIERVGPRTWQCDHWTYFQYHRTKCRYADLLTSPPRLENIYKVKHKGITNARFPHFLFIRSHSVLDFYRKQLVMIIWSYQRIAFKLKAANNYMHGS